MRRLLVTTVSAFALAGCPTYDRYDKLADQKGMLPADEFAKYGPEAAQKIAIGRALAQAHTGDTPADFARQMGVAVAFAKTMPDVVDIKADTLAYFMTIRFKSGWRTAVLPVADGKKPEETPGLKS
jgi:hypothetical protein